MNAAAAAVRKLRQAAKSGRQAAIGIAADLRAVRTLPERLAALERDLEALQRETAALRARLAEHAEDRALLEGLLIAQIHRAKHYRDALSSARPPRTGIQPVSTFATDLDPF